MTQTDAAASAGERDTAKQPSTAWQTGVGLAIVLAALVLALGAWQVPVPTPVEDGGARLVPGLCAAVLCVCGGWLVWEARHGGWRNASALSGGLHLQVTPWVWVSAGLLLSALLIRHSGFVLAGALCYVLALQGLRLAAQPDGRLHGARLAADVLIGLVLAVLVYLLFTRVLGIALPAGWLAWM